MCTYCLVGHFELHDSSSDLIYKLITELNFRPSCDSLDNICSKAFSRERVFEAACQGDTDQLSGLLDYLMVNKKQLTSPEYTGE